VPVHSPDSGEISTTFTWSLSGTPSMIGCIPVALPHPITDAHAAANVAPRRKPLSTITSSDLASISFSFRRDADQRMCHASLAAGKATSVSWLRYDMVNSCL
jgi:hypothetical protein